MNRKSRVRESFLLNVLIEKLYSAYIRMHTSDYSIGSYFDHGFEHTQIQIFFKEVHRT